MEKKNSGKEVQEKQIKKDKRMLKEDRRNISKDKMKAKRQTKGI